MLRDDYPYFDISLPAEQQQTVTLSLTPSLTPSHTYLLPHFSLTTHTYSHIMDLNTEGSGGDMYLPGAASLLEQLDRRILIILRDGRHLVGMLRSFDQFLNLVIEDTSERILMPGTYCDVPLGLYIVRGDNIVLLGEIDAEKEENEMPLRKVDPEDLEDIPEMSEEKLPWDFE